MKKSILFTCFLFLVSVTSLEASVYKGHRLFKVKCLKCHGKALDFVISKSSFEWEELMKQNGKFIRSEHLEREEAKDAVEYFNSDRYPLHVKHYRDFFLEYASDTGNIPACD